MNFPLSPILSLFFLGACPAIGPTDSLTTPAAKSTAERVRFVSFGDMGTGAQSQHQVARGIAKTCEEKSCDFAVTLGDNIYNDGVRSVNDPQFRTKFEEPYAQLPFRFYMSLGNHDYRGNVEAQIDYTSHSGKWFLPRRYYSFRSGPVSFLALDTNEPDAAQLAFVKDWLKTVNTPWRIAFGHHPRYTNSHYKNTQSPELKKLLDSLCGEVDLYLSGHEHDKQHLQAVCGMEHLIVGTGAGLRTAGTGKNTLFAKSSLGFAWFDATAEQLRFELLDDKGKSEYRYILPRAPHPLRTN